MLSDAEKKRYSRQIRLFGEDGQEKLKRTSVFIAGAGGLGSVISLYMAAAGFGKIRICDCDAVELSNLNRQILHANADVGRPKSQSAYETLTGINPEIEVEALVETISQDNIDQLLQGCDLIMDAMDNFPVRYLLNRAALQEKDPALSRGYQRLPGPGYHYHSRQNGLPLLHLPASPSRDNLPGSGQHLRCDRLHSGD